MKIILRIPIAVLFISINVMLMHAQWIQTNSPPGDVVYTFEKFPNQTGSVNLFAGTGDNGIYRTSDYGTNWTVANNGFTKTIVYSLAKSGNNLFAGVYGDGVFRSIDTAATWSAVNVGLTDTAVYALAVSNNNAGETNILAGTWGSGIFRSVDSGENWTATNSGLPQYTYVNAFAIFPNEGVDQTIFAGTWSGVYRSTDNALTWTEVNFGLPVMTQQNLITSSKSAGGKYIDATTHDAVILRKLAHPRTAKAGAADIYVTALAISPREPEGMNLFAAVYGEGVFLSTDSGMNWTLVNNGLTNFNVQVFAVTPNNTGGTNIYAGTWGNGVFLSTNNGTSWSPLNLGLASANITSLVIMDSCILAGTNEDGVWRFSLPELVTSINQKPDNVITRFELAQNYPNPFNPSTTINYQVPMDGYVLLKIYDVLGNEVATVVNKTQEAGSYSVRFDGSMLSSGPYFYRLNSGTFSESKKMVLMK